MAEQNKLSPEKLKAMEKNAEEFCRVKMEEPKEERGTEEYGKAIANWYRNYITPLIEECKKPEYGGLSWAEITTAGFEENGGVKKGSLLEKALDAVYPKEVAIYKGLPKFRTIPNTVVSNSLQETNTNKSLIGAGKQNVSVIPIQNGEDITIIANVSLEQAGLIINGREYNEATCKDFTEADRAVNDAVCSLFYDCNKQGFNKLLATAETIYRARVGGNSNKKVTQKQIQAIEISLEKQRNIKAFINATDEMEKRGIVRFPTEEGKNKYFFEMNGHLLDFIVKPVIVKGKKVPVYEFSEPLLLNYANETKQLITVNNEIFNIKKIKNGIADNEIYANSDERNDIKSYLIRRIYTMKYDEEKAQDAYRKYKAKQEKSKEPIEKTIEDFRNDKLKRTILIETVFDVCRITDKNTKTNSKEFICIVLDYWITKGILFSYKKRKCGKSFDAITDIEFFKKPEEKGKFITGKF